MVAVTLSQIRNINSPPYTKPLADQYNDHIWATVGLRNAVPLLNGYASRANIQKAKIALVSQQLQVDVAKQDLKNDIYKTYEEAIAASQNILHT
ncbi:MAG: TolC family protein [Bacteroidetes bacterium]|nr:TolC family protein [Bacteroidota bacterium]